MKYKHYKTEDFIADEYFQQWILDPDPVTDDFWKNWLTENPGKKDIVEEAREMVSILDRWQGQDPGLSGTAIKMSWQDIDWRTAKKTQPGTPAYSGSAQQPPFGNQGKKRQKNPWLKVAIGFCVVFGVFYGIDKSGILEKAARLSETASPQVTLELQDGSIEVIDETTSQIITTAKGQRVVSQEKNVLVYANDPNTETEGLVYNQLTVPYGKKFELVLSDGSHIFLNSGSKLRYPVKFLSERPRDVFLDGEAFFEVEKDETRPFTVVTGEMNTKVLGTKFNVTSYKNENNTHTVLVEGSVGVYKPDDTQGKEEPLLVKPGQRAVFENGSIGVEEVKIEKYTAWTRGQLYFVDDKFDLIIKELERHYNVKIENKYEALNKRRLTSTFKDEPDLERVLHIFQKIVPFDYVKERNTITITTPE
ncbi:FecR family protein [Sinomicrobium weinanense]|uniref:FecR domain-containing protein n=1 Tax=Sinomicrobium weinanense TaxID=2842200 RepID=A0A926JPS1_9FLAO|nr:FecR domain-containing protein [Sinomicrobium weinanense]MBC9795124.1 FecR domain-containing protein [Sinomicrobium weinanense]MBU3123744.1 FecR domain-containing protein [Sinomicrobium weinanense]